MGETVGRAVRKAPMSPFKWAFMWGAGLSFFGANVFHWTLFASLKLTNKDYVYAAERTLDFVGTAHAWWVVLTPFCFILTKWLYGPAKGDVGFAFWAYGSMALWGYYWVFRDVATALMFGASIVEWFSNF